MHGIGTDCGRNHNSDSSAVLECHCEFSQNKGKPHWASNWLMVAHFFFFCLCDEIALFEMQEGLDSALEFNVVPLSTGEHWM